MFVLNLTDSLIALTLWTVLTFQPPQQVAKSILQLLYIYICVINHATLFPLGTTLAYLHVVVFDLICMPLQNSNGGTVTCVYRNKLYNNCHGKIAVSPFSN